MTTCPNKSRKSVLVWCHGGCFGGGKVSYDAALRRIVKNNGVEVSAVDFTKLYPNALTEIVDVAKYYMKRDYLVIMGGISSGGLLAHTVANQLYLPALLIAPVLAPHSRHNAHGVLTDSQRDLQLLFFGDMDTMLKAEHEALSFPNNIRYIMYGKNDSRAPEVNFIRWADHHPSRVKLYEVDASHNDLCQYPPLDVVVSWMNMLIQS